MRLVVKKDDKVVNEIQFDGKDPVYIGRSSKNRVVLPESSVSKRHAVVFKTDDGKWMVEDLDSSNKTYLNNHAIHKAEIKTGDYLRITSFTVEVNLESGSEAGKSGAGESAADDFDFDDMDFSDISSGEGQSDALKMESDELDIGELSGGESGTAETEITELDTDKSDTFKSDTAKTEAIKSDTAKTEAAELDSAGLVAAKPDSAKPAASKYTTTATRGQQEIIRKPGAEKSPSITVSAERAVDFLQATDAIGKADSLDKVLLVLLNIVAKQCNAHHIWCALRNQPTGPMTAHAGIQRDGRPIELNEIEFNDKISDAIEAGKFLLFIFSRDLSLEKSKQIRSVMIAPIISPAGCFGVLYTNNTFREDHYSLTDLDYLMLLSIHTATVIRRL